MPGLCLPFGTRATTGKVCKVPFSNLFYYLSLCHFVGTNNIVALDGNYMAVVVKGSSSWLYMWIPYSVFVSVFDGFLSKEIVCSSALYLFNNFM